MAGLADDWPENRQTCVDVLCSYLRMPYAADPGEDASEPDRLAFAADREVRHTAIRVITNHLKADSLVPWHGLDLDFTGVVFDGGDFTEAEFNGGNISFTGAVFTGFVDFCDARFSATVSFARAKFCDGCGVNFGLTRYLSGLVLFDNADFRGGDIVFTYAEFSGARVNFASARFSGAHISFTYAEFSGSHVSFVSAKFTGGTVDLAFADFRIGTVSFPKALFTGSKVLLRQAIFTGTKVEFGRVADWSCPPALPEGKPTGLALPPQPLPDHPPRPRIS
jgi:uncharacterized protein YjbI with pentapeptide repeats